MEIKRQKQMKIDDCFLTTKNEFKTQSSKTFVIPILMKYVLRHNKVELLDTK